MKTDRYRVSQLEAAGVIWQKYYRQSYDSALSAAKDTGKWTIGSPHHSWSHYCQWVGVWKAAREPWPGHSPGWEIVAIVRRALKPDKSGFSVTVFESGALELVTLSGVAPNTARVIDCKA